MNRRSLYTVLLVAGAALAAPVANAAEPTRKDAEALVRKAADLLKAQGRSKLIEAVNVKDGEFHRGELYVFVYDDKATILAHPINAKLIGRNTFDLPDAGGKFYRKEIVELAKSKGQGWVDYKYKNPVSGKVEDKVSFVLASQDVILVAGVYKD
jgi:cytochrome c